MYSVVSVKLDPSATKWEPIGRTEVQAVNESASGQPLAAKVLRSKKVAGSGGGGKKGCVFDSAPASQPFCVAWTTSFFPVYDQAGFCDLRITVYAAKPVVVEPPRSGRVSRRSVAHAANPASHVQHHRPHEFTVRPFHSWLAVGHWLFFFIHTIKKHHSILFH